MRRAVLLLAACQVTVFKTTIEDTASTTVPAATLLEELLGDIGFGDFVAMDLTESEELADQGVEPGDIREVFLVDFVLTATRPPGADLAFIDALDVYVSAPGLPEVLVASQTDFPAGLDSVTFDLEDVDLTDYVESQAMTLTTTVVASRPSDETTVEAAYAVEVSLTGQGACNQL